MVLLPMFSSDLSAISIYGDEASSVLELAEKCAEESRNAQLDRLDDFDAFSKAHLFGAKKRDPIAELEIAWEFNSQFSSPPKNKSPPIFA